MANGLASKRIVICTRSCDDGGRAAGSEPLTGPRSGLLLGEPICSISLVMPVSPSTVVSPQTHAAATRPEGEDGRRAIAGEERQGVSGRGSGADQDQGPRVQASPGSAKGTNDCEGQWGAMGRRLATRPSRQQRHGDDGATTS